jgi:hypothetical protein
LAVDLGAVESFTDKQSVDGTYGYRVSARSAAGMGPATLEAVVSVSIRLTDMVQDSPPLAPNVPEQQWVGTIPGLPSVEGGTASYRIDIEVPPGRVGMQPRLALTYGSRNGNGLAGVGWALSGTDTIYRCPNTLAQDGANRPVRHDGSDRLCFSGQRLVPIRGQNLATGSEYRTEIDEFSRITLLAGGPAPYNSYFKVEHKSGRISHYEALATASPEADSWSLTREYDPQGNCLVHSYQGFSLDDTGHAQEWVPSSIQYTGTGSEPDRTCDFSSDARRVDFQYTADRPDRRTTYVYGVPSGLTARLAAIVTYAPDAPVAPSGVRAVRRYDLAYRLSAATWRSLLDHVTLCAGETCGAAKLPPTTFSYREGPPVFVNQQYRDGAGNLLGADWLVQVTGDYDGDGTRDKILAQKTPQGFLRSLELSGCRSTETHLDGTSWLLGFDAPDNANPRYNEGMDINRDGRADLLGTSGGLLALGTRNCAGWKVATAGLDLSAQSFANGGAFYRPLSAVDYDGDGIPDVSVLDGSFTRTVYRGSRDQSGNVTYLKANVLPSTPTPSNVNLTPTMESDLNADGHVDTLFDGFLATQHETPLVTFQPAEPVNTNETTCC